MLNDADERCGEAGESAARERLNDANAIFTKLKAMGKNRSR